MNRKVESFELINGVIEVRLNSSSKIVSVSFNEFHGNLEIEYFKSPFDSQLDIYKFEVVLMSDIFEFNNHIGETFYGKYWDEFSKEWLLLFGKQTDRIYKTQ